MRTSSIGGYRYDFLGLLALALLLLLASSPMIEAVPAKASNGGQQARQSRSGFVGMRGKKSEEYGYPPQPLDNYIADYYAFEDEQPQPEKRKSGFLGMRGKKDNMYSPEMSDDEIFSHMYKRAGFLGMRGKKANQVWFYRPSSW